MTKFVVDASVAAKWLVAEALSEKAIALLDADRDLQAPDLLPTEVGNVLWKKVRAGDLSAEQASERLALLSQMGVKLTASVALGSQALELSMNIGRTFYDSLYIALALNEDCQFVTADERLVNALRGTPYEARIAWLGTLQLPKEE